MNTKRTLKFLHTLGGMGVMGAIAANLILLTITPDPSSLEEYALMRQSIGLIAERLLLPSLAVVLLSGLLSMAVHAPFHNMGWVWMKLGLGVIMFEGTLLSVQGPAERAAIESQRALAGEVDPAVVVELVKGEWGSMWVILMVAVVNVALAVWRPKFQRKRAVAAAASG